MKGKSEDMQIHLDSLGMRVLFQSLGKKYRFDVYSECSELMDDDTNTFIKRYTPPASMEEILDDCRDYKDNGI